ncbi:MAG TPA: methyltransferase [Candidatus Eremiobacteraeota bacterium]|nr:MAG: Release factor glutamine methyltransferase [bacterium ADurb.Bin363]HPZ08503.1 methyltransferase [Candidatus Eremiobacteraeota bacterium]
MVLDTEIIDIIRKLLEEFNYRRIISIPVVGSVLFPLSEPGNIINFFRGRQNRLYSHTLGPSFYEYCLQVKDKSLYILFNLFFKNLYVGKNAVKILLGHKNFSIFLSKGILRIDGDFVYSLIKISPFGRFYFISTSIPFYKDFNTRVYIGIDSVCLANNLIRFLGNRYYERALDICSGSGIQSLVLSEFSGEVTGVDINPVAIDFAANNAFLNKRNNVKFLLSDLYNNLEGKYDIIVSNPPYGFFPDNLKHWLPGYGGELGIEIPLKIIEGLDSYLSPRGRGFMCLSSPIVDGRDLILEKLEEMFSKKDFSIKAAVIEHCINADLLDFYKKQRVKYFKFYHLLFQKGEKYSLSVEDLSMSRKIEFSYAIVLLKLFSRYNSYVLKKQTLICKNLLLEGKKELSSGNLEKAEKLFRKILMIRPYDLESHLELGEIYIRQNKLELAENYFEDSLKLYPPLVEGYWQLAYIYRLKKNKDKAEEYLKKACNLAKDMDNKELEREIRKMLRSLRLEED